MRAVFTWLMVFGVLAGLSSRIIAMHENHEVAAVGVEDSCCPHDHDAPANAPHENGKCPPDHHHHGCCFAAMPLTVDHAGICRLGISALSLFGIRHEGEIAPEEPLLSSEKPPLI